MLSFELGYLNFISVSFNSCLNLNFLELILIDSLILFKNDFSFFNYSLTNLIEG